MDGFLHLPKGIPEHGIINRAGQWSDCETALRLILARNAGEGTAVRRWRGRPHANCCNNRSWTPLNILNREPDHLDPLLRQPPCPPIIMGRSVSMHRSIDLDTKPRSRTVKVKDVRTNRVLAAKVQSLLIAPEERPQRFLRLRHRATQGLRPLLRQN